MADTITSTSELYIGLTNSNDKLQYLQIPNPRPASATEESITSAAEYFVTNKILIDDYGAVISDTEAVTTAYIQNDTINNLDV